MSGECSIGTPTTKQQVPRISIIYGLGVKCHSKSTPGCVSSQREWKKTVNGRLLTAQNTGLSNSILPQLAPKRTEGLAIEQGFDDLIGSQSKSDYSELYERISCLMWCQLFEFSHQYCALGCISMSESNVPAATPRASLDALIHWRLLPHR